MFTNGDITLYKLVNGSYARETIEGVYMEDRKTANVIKSGLTNADSLFVCIPKGSLSGKLSLTVGKDLVVKGKCTFEFDNTSQITQSTSLKELKGLYTVYTVSDIADRTYGSEVLQHWELSCK